MIRIGFDAREKQAEVTQYLVSHPEIKQMFVFYPEAFPFALDAGSVAVEYVEYKDIIEYKPFYHLLEVIDPLSLLVFNECMRTQNRSDLTYNCAHHYANQTGHKIVFEHFPFIERADDFMILLDFQNKGRYKGKGFDRVFLADEDIMVIPRAPSLSTIDLQLPDREFERYEDKKRKLFDALGNGDPDTIPRQLHVFAGNYKKNAVDPDLHYVARNARFNLPNVRTYRDVGRTRDYIVIDFPHRRIDFNDFLKRSGMTEIRFLNSGLKVDRYYIDDMRGWIGRLEGFYAQAGIRP